MKNTQNGVTAGNLRRAAVFAERIEGYQAKINDLTAQMQACLGTTLVGSVPTSAPSKRGKGGGMSPAQKARIGAAMKAKWAARKAANSKPAAPAAKQPSGPTQATPAAQPATTPPVA